MKAFAGCLLLLMGLSLPAQATITRLVTSAEDNQGEGTLRTILQNACDEPNDDLILFDKTRLPEIRILLTGPLVIPHDCNGFVTITGSTQVDTILDASLFANQGHATGDSCTLDIYSDGHTIANFTFTANTTGTGACLFGRRNTIRENRFGTEQSGTVDPNRDGVVIYDIFRERWPAMDGASNIVHSNRFGPEGQSAVAIHANNNVVSDNTIRQSGDSGVILMGAENEISHNSISGNAVHGIWVKATGGHISANDIRGNGGCPTPAEVLTDQPPGCAPEGHGGAGIFISAGATNVTIGGPHFRDDKNVIQFNMAGGIFLEDASSIASIDITHNRISLNYGHGLGIDFRGDGVTPNDLTDADTGPNTLLNFSDHMQSFPLVPSPSGAERYWSWGVAFDGARVELYDVAIDDLNRSITHGGGDTWVFDRPVQDDTFQLMPTEHPLVAGETLTTLLFDPARDTSEYGLNVRVGPDKDLDGIVDALEKVSAPSNADTDGDGLPDSVEDANRNGAWENTAGETNPVNPDTDGDGASDWVETHGDGHDDAGIDTDPLNPDTDGDGLLDGKEDTNGNGIWEGYLNETSPLLKDSDGDGFSDNADSCPIIPNPSQEPWYCESP